nr:ABC transporter permease [Pseudomonadota bacterium]
IYVPLDNTVASALEGVIKVGHEADLPVYSADTDSVERGTLAALGFDYYDVGRQTGRLVARVLNGERPADLPVEAVEKLNLFLNLKAAAAMNVTVPEAVVRRAAKVIGE